ncbi:sodium:dicarboxylate symporter [Psychromonas sp. PRT-SC03]|nr:sodium:dicarboxylate symporter [Psychromonas sp. PRT-SC03]
MWKKLAPYKSSIVLLIALTLGATLGIIKPEFALKLKPIGRIFLNLLFMIIVPLVGISVMSSIAGMTDLKKLGKLLVIILFISIIMELIPAAAIIALASFFDPAQGVTLDLAKNFVAGKGELDFVNMLTTDDFVGLLSKSNILALIIMSIMGGIAIGQAGEKGKKIAELLDCANAVVMNIVAIIMKFAPIGLGSFFAATMAEQDPKLLSTFAVVIGLFFSASIVYYILGSTVYAYIGAGWKGVKIFWRNAAEPSITALATCSSLGTLPVNIRAAKKMGIQDEMADICLPLFVNLNKGGVAMVAALKIMFVYSLLNLPFTPQVFAITMLLSVLSAIIVGGVPGGAFLGEIFIVTALGLPVEVIPILVVIGAATDALATVINVIHDLPATLIVERIMRYKSK